ncbi:hypothetical protein AAC03nite_20080 [Alicyclobacillus acidoterrestris]|nr:hypothetical protein AAC03nite_20080 [Alicyclobacillus acidoterrestris]
MVDLTEVQYGLEIVQGSGQVIAVPGVRSLTFQENTSELAMSVQVDADNQQINGSWLHELAALGSWVVVWADWGAGKQEVFRGIVFVNDPILDTNLHFQLTAYDPLIYLDKSKDDRYYPAGKTGAEILTDIFKSWNVPIGSINGPNKKLGIQVFHGQTVADMVNSVLQQSVLAGDDIYLLQFSNGKVNVIEAGKNTPVYKLTTNDAVMSVEDEWSIEDLVTRVKITGKTNPNGSVQTAATVDGLTQFGILQEIISQQSYDGLAQAKQAAQMILQQNGQPIPNRQVTAVDIPFLRRGDAVYMEAGTLNGQYIISGIQHDAGSRTMTIQFNNIIGAAKYPRNKQSTNSSSKTGVGAIPIVW